MMNLEIVNFEDFGLVELNAYEIQEVNGGNGIHSGGYGLIDSGCGSCWGDFLRGFLNF